MNIFQQTKLCRTICLCPILRCLNMFLSASLSLPCTDLYYPDYYIDVICDSNSESVTAILIVNMLLFSLIQGIRVDLSCKQLTVDFVNQSVLQMSGQDVESKRSDKTDFAERLGAMNRRWQILQGRINERVRP